MQAAPGAGLILGRGRFDSGRPRRAGEPYPSQESGTGPSRLIGGDQSGRHPKTRQNSGTEAALGLNLGPQFSTLNQDILEKMQPENLPQ